MLSWIKSALTVICLLGTTEGRWYGPTSLTFKTAAGKMFQSSKLAVGNTYKVVCHTDDVYPGAVVDWSGNYMSIGVRGKTEQSGLTYSRSFTFTATRKLNKRTINCLAFNAKSPKIQVAKSLKLEIIFGPTELTATSGNRRFKDGATVEVEEGKDVILTCATDPVYPNVNLKWESMNGASIDTPGVNFGTIYYTKVIVKQLHRVNKTVRCIGENSAHSAFNVQLTLTLISLYGPNKLIFLTEDGAPFEDGTLLYSRTYTVICKTDESFPSAIIKCSNVDQKFVKVTSDYENEKQRHTVLSLVAHQSLNGQSLYCTASNSRITQSVTARLPLAVHFGPTQLTVLDTLNAIIYKDGDNLTVTVGKSYVLVCQTDPVYPDVDINWIGIEGLHHRANTTLEKNGTIYSLDLAFTASSSTTNLVTCTANNSEYNVFKASAQLLIKAEQRTFGPTRLTFTSEDGALFNSSALVHGQTYTVLCVTDEVFPAAVIHWSKTYPASGSFASTNKSGSTFYMPLTFLADRQYHSEQWHCVAKNTEKSGNNISKSLFLRIVSGPMKVEFANAGSKTYQDGDEFAIVEDDYSEVSCSTDLVYPGAHIEITGVQGDTEVVEKEMPNNLLVVTKKMKFTSGFVQRSIKCVAVNVANTTFKAEATLSVTIIGGPGSVILKNATSDEEFKEEQVEAIRNKVVHIRCHVGNLLTSPRVQWLTNVSSTLYNTTETVCHQSHGQSNHTTCTKDVAFSMSPMFHNQIFECLAVKREVPHLAKRKNVVIKLMSIDGNWSPWKPSGKCSVTCSTGVQLAKRACTNPPPSRGGLPCMGVDERLISCENPWECDHIEALRYHSFLTKTVVSKDETRALYGLMLTLCIIFGLVIYVWFMRVSYVRDWECFKSDSRDEFDHIIHRLSKMITEISHQKRYGDDEEEYYRVVERHINDILLEEVKRGEDAGISSLVKHDLNAVIKKFTDISKNVIEEYAEILKPGKDDEKAISPGESLLSEYEAICTTSRLSLPPTPPLSALSEESDSEASTINTEQKRPKKLFQITSDVQIDSKPRDNMNVTKEISKTLNKPLECQSESNSLKSLSQVTLYSGNVTCNSEEAPAKVFEKYSTQNDKTVLNTWLLKKSREGEENRIANYKFPMSEDLDSVVSAPSKIRDYSQAMHNIKRTHALPVATPKEIKKKSVAKNMQKLVVLPRLHVQCLSKFRFTNSKHQQACTKNGNTYLTGSMSSPSDITDVGALATDELGYSEITRSTDPVYPFATTHVDLSRVRADLGVTDTEMTKNLLVVNKAVKLTTRSAVRSIRCQAVNVASSSSKADTFLKITIGRPSCVIPRIDNGAEPEELKPDSAKKRFRVKWLTNVSSVPVNTKETKHQQCRSQSENVACTKDCLLSVSFKFPTKHSSA